MSLEISMFDECHSCRGEGINYKADPIHGKCPDCRGTGNVPSELGQEVLTLLCVWGDTVRPEPKAVGTMPSKTEVSERARQRTKRLLCTFGFHVWHYQKEEFFTHRGPNRMCFDCGREETYIGAAEWKEAPARYAK